MALLKSDMTDIESQIEVSRYLRFWSLVIGILFFFGCHNYMQELIMTLPGFKVNLTNVFQVQTKIYLILGWCISWLSRSSWGSFMLLF